MIEAALSTLALICQDETPIELRVLPAIGKLVTRRFTSHTEALSWVDQFAHPKAVYVVMNPFDEARIKKDAVDDAAVTARKWLFEPYRDHERAVNVSHATAACS